jgi:hypothetical protein
MTLLACKPAEAPLRSGHIGLEYVGILGSNVEFRLENGSSKTISFRGEFTRPAGADPWDTQIECAATNGATMYEHPIVLVVEDPVSIKVSPGEQMRLLLGIAITREGKGSLCRLRLKLQDRMIVESREFVP